MRRSLPSSIPGFGWQAGAGADRHPGVTPVHDLLDVDEFDGPKASQARPDYAHGDIATRTRAPIPP